MKSLLALAFAATLAAQNPPQATPPSPQGPTGPMPRRGPGPGFGGPAGPGFPAFAGGPGGPGMPGMPGGLRGLPGKWWQDPNIRQRLGLTDDQRNRMEEVFRAQRLRLIDLNANLQREEAALEPLIEADQIDESKAVAQSDRVVQARAELEKTNSRFLIAIRRILTPDQWRKMEAERRQMRPSFGPPAGARPPQQD